MTISANAVWECRSDGADTNGGGFVFGASGTDRSQSTTPFANGTNLTVDATTNTDVTPDGYSPVAADVGNLIQITTTGGGAAFTVGFYEILSIQGGTKWRLDRSPAATSSAGATWAMGGALISPALACGGLGTDGNTIWLRGGATPSSAAYVVTNATINIIGGRLKPAKKVTINGYGTTRGDGVKAVMKLGFNIAAPLVSCETQDIVVRNIELDGVKATYTSGSNRGTLGNNRAHYYNVYAHDFAGDGFNGLGTMCIACRAESNGNVGYSVAGTCILCVAKSNTGKGFANASIVSWILCVATGNGNGGFNTEAVNAVGFGCVSYGNTGDGFAMSTLLSTFVNCIAMNNTLYGFASGGTYTYLKNCAAKSNTSGNVQNTTTVVQDGFITLTADPFTNAASGDFSLNNTSGGGALLRGLGFGNVGNAGLTVGYPDVGAAQHLEVSGGGGVVNNPIVRGVRG